MGTIQHLFNKTVTIRRKQSLSGFRKDFTTVTASQDTHIQRPANPSVIDIEGVDRAEYTAWMDISADILKNDMVIDGDGNIYIVAAVIKQGEDTAINEHKEVILANYPK